MIYTHHTSDNMENNFIVKDILSFWVDFIRYHFLWISEHKFTLQISFHNIFDLVQAQVGQQ